MIWNTAGKPSVLAYANVNPVGKEQYDEPSLTYDDSSTFYDGTNPNQWTDISKPTASIWTNVSKPV